MFPALDSPGASHNKSRDRRETSEDESDQIVVKHGRESVKAHNSKAGDKSDRSYTGSEYSSSEYETDSDADETAVISPKDKTDKGSKPKSKTYKEEDRSKSGPTFTFRTKDAKTPATRRQTEEVNVDEDTNATQEEFLAGYKVSGNSLCYFSINNDMWSWFLSTQANFPKWSDTLDILYYSVGRN